MSSPSSTQPTAVQPQAVVTGASSAQIDASCRIPVLHFFFGALTWLAVGSVLAVLASIKMHGSFLDGSAWLTYGRVQPAAMHALVYGFASQSGLGVAIWILARLGRRPVVGAIIPTFAGILWNLGVAAGIAGILAGKSTGHLGLEAPLGAAVLLGVGFGVVAVWALAQFHRRQPGDVYVSQWYILGALFWFPWLFLTALTLLVVAPVRGVMQSVVAWWFVNGLAQLWLGGLGLATVFYFVPKLAKRPLHSRPLATLGFWLLALLGGFGGIPLGAPVPRWMPSLSTVGTMLMIVPVLAVAINLVRTVQGSDERKAADSPAMRYVLFGAASYFLAMFGRLLGSGVVPGLSQWTDLTFYGPAVSHLFLLGFFGLTMLGAIHYIVPLLVGRNWARPGFSGASFWFCAVGVLLTTAALVVGGFVQGEMLNFPLVPAAEAARKVIPFLGLATLGWVLLALGGILVGTNFKLTLFQACLECCQAQGWCKATKAKTGGKP